MKLWPIAMGIGAAAGAVAIMMMPTNNPTRKAASRAAHKMEDAVSQAADKISTELSN